MAVKNEISVIVSYQGGNEMLEKMKTRRSIRKFKSDMVPKEIIEKIVEAGTYAAYGKRTRETM